jgi:hypothetical protein
MKFKPFFHFVLTAILMIALTLGLSKINKAYAVGEVKNVIVSTLCCSGNTQTGNANDCVSGGGNCVDHSCAGGESETGNGSCLLP